MRSSSTPVASPLTLALVFAVASLATACGSSSDGSDDAGSSDGGASAAAGTSSGSAGTDASGHGASAGASGHGATGGTASAGKGGGAGSSGNAAGGSGGTATGKGGSAGSTSTGKGGGTSTGGSAGSGAGGSGDPFGGMGGTSSATGGTSSGGTSGGAGGSAPASPTTDYAPYFYTWGWGDSSSYAFSSLAELKKKSDISGITIAFVLADNGCKTTGDIPDNLADVDAFRAAGGKVKASFGGADGQYIENGCDDAAGMAKAIEDFVKKTKITDLDFDVEQGGAVTSTVNERRAQALKTVQDDLGIKVSFTLPANPGDKNGKGGGMPGNYVTMVKTVIDAGVTISHINMMVMDYGDALANDKMSDVAFSSLLGTHQQIIDLYPGISDQDAWQMVGATPMIGHNDDSEVFQLSDAQALADFTKKNHLGLVAFWAIQRDQPGSGDLNRFTGVNKGTFDFHKILQTVTQ